MKYKVEVTKNDEGHRGGYVLTVTYDGEVLHKEHDCGWVGAALIEAYELGLKDGAHE